MLGVSEGRGVLKIKLGIFYFCMFIDIILSTFVAPHLNASNSQTSSPNNIVVIVISVIQIAVNFMLLILFLILMWQTVPLRYGMVFDLLRQFKLVIFLNLIMFALIAAERIYRLIILNIGDKNSAVLAEDYPIYYIIYYVKYLVYPFFYAIILEGSLKLALPVYYNVKKWESN